MGNKLFQLARDAVQRAEASIKQGDSQAQAQVETAKNNLSSAYANSTNAERDQLRQFQQQLDNATSNNEK
ncbi:DUF3813 domain-containing protein [Bacillus solimangrovi]|uniref:DUF3813 domain-containing protein n=1 Tax=Bacillus solimangrovi TaxID=1305675 RepID=A0A1E5LC30_9BACI|nr:DUF3813 domain-containing protein [Bacillus solimangrovi]OEH91650.1 hypothetical protein BFG57_04570 [Bacillus solimangrovi]